MVSELAIPAISFLTSPEALAHGFESDAFVEEEGLPVVEALSDSYAASGLAADRLLEKLNGHRLALRQKDWEVARSLGVQVAAAVRRHPKTFQKLLPRVCFQLFGDAETARAQSQTILYAGHRLNLEPEIEFLNKWRFLLGMKVNEGGYAAIYLSEDRTTGEKMVIKLFHDESKQCLESSRREAGILSRLDHPGIPKIFHFGEDGREDLMPYPSFADQPRPYLVLEYADGGDLRQRLDEQKHLRWEEVREIALQLCLVLQAVHKAGFIHRDVKPDNVVLKKKGEKTVFQLIDWHTALDLNDEQQRRKEKGKTIGSHCYMSPEQYFGMDVDQRSDIYALGVVLFELLTGSNLFIGSVGEVLYAHLSKPLPSLKSVRPDIEIPAGVQEILSAALAKNRADRFQSAAEMAAAIEAVS